MKFSELYPLKRILRMFWLKLLPVLPMRGTLRFKLMRFAGVDVELGGDWGGGFIGHGTKLDSLYPEDIHLGKCVRINMDCIIMTHHLRPNNFCNGDKVWGGNPCVFIKKRNLEDLPTE